MEAKRVAPPKVEPVEIDGIRYEAVHWGRERGLGQNGGIIAAVDAASGEELWTLKVYDIDYRDDLETDIQDVFIKSMSKTWIGKKLKVRDEKNRQYLVDVESQTVEAK